MGVTLDLSPSQEHGEWVFEKRLMKSIFGLNREEVKGGWKELHNWGGWQRQAANYCSSQGSHRKRRPHFKTYKCLGRNKNMVMGPYGA
jgi:hypothetical protein